MASGNTHDLATLGLATGLAIASQFFVPALESQWWWEGTVSLALAAGALAGLWISPDLDLEKCNALRRWGLLKIIWAPYRAIIPCHRHWMSHLPIAGTFGRVFYLLFPLALAIGSDRIIELAHEPHVLAFVLGLAIADIGHWLLDGMPVRL